MKSFFLFAIAALWLLAPGAVYAEEDPCPDPGTFGCFEVGLPGGNGELAAGQSIDAFVSKGTPILNFINVAVKVVLALVVIIGVISIVVGGYIYMTAGGNANQVGTAKEVIKAALFGIVIALTSVVILNTINTFLGSGAKEPELGSGSGAGDRNALGSNAENNTSGGTLPSSNNNPAQNNGSGLQPEAESSNPPDPGLHPDPSNNAPSSGTPFNPGLQPGAPQSISITVRGTEYLINNKVVSLDDIVALSKQTTGEPGTGIRVYITQEASLTAKTERTLVQTLINKANVDPNSLVYPSSLDPGFKPEL